jgi:glutamate dehydrogenase (NADP+)
LPGEPYSSAVRAQLSWMLTMISASRRSVCSKDQESRLAEIMVNIHDNCARTAEEYGSPGNYVVGANINGFVRVADAMLAQGVI